MPGSDPPTNTNPNPNTTPQIDASTKSFIDTIATKLNTLTSSISAKTISSITCANGSPCYKVQQTSLLKDKYEKAQQHLQNAPLELSLAERNMYEYNRGDPGGDFIYNTTIIDRFANTAQELQQNSIDKQQEFMANLTQALRQYQAQVLFLNRTQELLKTRLQENADLIQKKELFTKILHTNERKVVYEKKDTSSIYTFRRVMLFFYYAAIIGYIIFGNFIPDKLYKKVSVWLIIIIASIIPIILNIIMKWIFIIGDVIVYWFKNEMPHRDIYGELKNFNYTNTKSNVPPVPSYVTSATTPTIT